MTSAERIRVHIAGNIHPKRGVVRRFLEDDGYDVIGETTSGKTLLAAIRNKEPDAIVVDDKLLSSGPGGGTLARIRKAAPDAKVIVFTSSPPSDAAATAGADGYLEKGVGLAALTSLLGRLFADETAGIELAAAGGGASATANGGSAATTARAVAIVGGAILIVWGMIAMLATGGGPMPPPADRTDRGGTVVAGDDSLDEAYASLRQLVTAIESGNYVRAGIEAEALMAARAQAAADGFALIGLDAEVTSRLGTIVDLLPLRVNSALSAILGSLYPVLPDEDVPGGGSDIVIGPVISAGTTGGADGGTTGREDGAGVIVVVDRGGAPGGGDDGADGGGSAPRPGDGREWGLSHIQRHVVGEVPPWANGKGVGHDKANGKAVGHGRSVGHNA